MPHIDYESLVETIGYAGLFLIVFSETGLLIGFFLPGDTLLVAAGAVAGRGHLDIWALMLVLFVAAVTGDAVGYQIGKHAGPRLFRREDSRWFHHKHLERARSFYNHHGGKTIVLARFVPIVRTFAPTIAGAAGMPYRRFAIFNVFGGLIWVVSMCGLGYVVGESVPNLEVALVAVVGIIFVLSIAPAAVHILRERRAARQRLAVDINANREPQS